MNLDLSGQSCRIALTCRELERQVDFAKRRNTKAEGIVATASHLMPLN